MEIDTGKYCTVWYVWIDLRLIVEEIVLLPRVSNDVNVWPIDKVTNERERFEWIGIIRGTFKFEIFEILLRREETKTGYFEITREV